MAKILITLLLLFMAVPCHGFMTLVGAIAEEGGEETTIDYWLCENTTTEQLAATVDLTTGTHDAEILAGGYTDNGLFVGGRWDYEYAVFPLTMADYSTGKISFRVKVTNWGAGFIILNLPNDSYGVSVSVVSSTQVKFRIYDGDDTITVAEDLKDGAWHTVSISWDSATNYRLLILDGTEYEINTAFSTPPNMQNIARVGGIASDYWIDDVYIYEDM